MKNDAVYFSKPEILEKIEVEYINQKTHPHFYYTKFRRGRCSPLCDGHCLKFVVVEHQQKREEITQKTQNLDIKLDINGQQKRKED